MKKSIFTKHLKSLRNKYPAIIIAATCILIICSATIYFYPTPFTYQIPWKISLDSTFFFQLFSSLAKVPAPIYGALITVTGGVLVFYKGTRKLEQIKEIREFHSKYIKIKNDIDYTRYLLNKNSADIDSNAKLLFSYINLLFEEALSIKNPYIEKQFHNWVEDFCIEIDEWERDIQKIDPSFFLQKLNLTFKYKNNNQEELKTINSFIEYFTFLISPEYKEKNSLNMHNSLLKKISDRFHKVSSSLSSKESTPTSLISTEFITRKILEQEARHESLSKIVADYLALYHQDRKTKG